MKPHPRIRKTIKWGGAAVTVLLVVVWIGSGWFACCCLPTQRSWVSVYGGQVTFGQALDGPITTRPIPIQRFESSILSFFESHSYPNRRWISSPIWLLALMTGCATTLAWYLDALARRRDRLNLCPKCHYDRAGIATDAKCPECGSAAP
jgi:hypothetical protein